MPRPHLSLLVALAVGCAVGTAPGRAAEPFRFPEGTFGKGELKYRNGLPVLTVAGTPAEIGTQVATLTGKPAARLLTYPREALEKLAGPTAAKLLYPVLVKKGKRLRENFPADYDQEFEAMLKVSGLDREQATLGNTVFDLKESFRHLFGCSALIVGPERSATGAPIFGRNMDYLSLGYLHEYTLVTVYRPTGKHAFAAVGYPGLVGCLSGMNDAGLAVTVLETTGADKEEGPPFSEEGVPFMLCYRRLLEECTTVDEAAKLLRSMKRTTTNNLAVCDRKGGAVFEITPSRVVVRGAERSVSVCTNHFCTKELRLAKPVNVSTTLDRLATLQKVQAADGKLGLAEVQKALDAVNQGAETLQTMVFEPASLTLHLAVAVGTKPSSAQPLKKLALAPLLGTARAKE